MGIHIHFVGMPGDFLHITAECRGGSSNIMLSSRAGIHLQASECLKEGKSSQIGSYPDIT